ncbi:MAG TPA: site-specific DNA-methyltransferase [Candidatus Acidoferrum sp.]|nr:site-specific DNA-methyltransferase [Candidatus Acidoferrum sp.]
MLKTEPNGLPAAAFEDSKHHLKIYQGDCLEILAAIPEGTVDLVFADPPYFLSNGGITCHAGRMVSVNKGEWDKSRGADGNHEFNRAWLSACQRVLKPNGSIWVSGTAHVIHSVGFAMQQLGFKLLNDISWVKPNPPPNLSCRYFTHATETIIWAARDKKSRHTFHYKLMKEINRGKQMKSVWEIYPPETWEKKFGKHPTQKPVALLERILLASSSEGDLVLDPFCGSGTTLLAALRLRRRGLGCELSADFLTLSIRRLCSNLVQVKLSLSSFHFSLDPLPDPMDRSNSGRLSKRASFCSGRSSDRLASTSERPCSGDFTSPSSSSAQRFSKMSAQLQLIQQERRFYFIGRADRRVIFSVLADFLEEARQKFRASGLSDSDVLLIIKTETEIYLA